MPDEVVAWYSPALSREEGEAVGIACALELIEIMKEVVTATILWCLLTVRQ